MKFDRLSYMQISIAVAALTVLINTAILPATAGTPDLGHPIWPGGIIYYQYAAGLDDSDKTKVRNAMDEWEDATDDYIEFRLGQNANGHYVLIEHDPNVFGLSGIGYQERSNQTFKINFDYQFQELIPGAIRHELGHTIGLNHEHSRPDRDDYIVVTIFEQTEDPDEYYTETPSDFAIMPNLVGYDTYDFSSVTHYLDNEPGSNGLVIPEIDVKDDYASFKGLAGAGIISASDVNAVKWLYEAETSNPNINTTVGSDDILFVGEFNESFAGDIFEGNGGNDQIITLPWTTVDGSLYGDSEFHSTADVEQSTAGNDSILVGGTVNGSVYGDKFVDRNSNASGGNDVIIIASGAYIQGGPRGAPVDALVGDDYIENRSIDGIGQRPEGEITIDCGSGTDRLINNGRIVGESSNNRLIITGCDTIQNSDFGTMFYITVVHVPGEEVDIVGYVEYIDIEGTAGNDTLNIGSEMDGGGFNGEEGEDSVTVQSGGLLSAGSPPSDIQLGDDNDTFVLQPGGKIEQGSDINGGVGNDTIILDGVVDNSKIKGSDNNDDVIGPGETDDDVIKNDGTIKNNSHISGGDGNDTIINNHDTTVADAKIRDSQVDGQSGDDTILNDIGGTILRTNLDGGQGNDTIINQGATIGSTTDASGVYQIQLGPGADEFINKDMIQGQTTYDAMIIGYLIIGGSDNNDGADTITNEAGAQLIDTDIQAGIGDDNITNAGIIEQGSSISGEEGDDSILIDTTGIVNNSDLNGNTGEDTITIKGTVEASSTVKGGNLDDNISIITGGEVKDSTIHGDDGSDTTGDGDDTITVALGAIADNTDIHGNAGNDSLRVTGDFQNGSTFNGDDGADSINVTNDGVVDNADLHGDAGADSITIQGNVQANSTVEGDGGPDSITITNPGIVDNSTVRGNAANDSILIEGDVVNNADVLGNAGADTIQVANNGTVNNAELNGNASDDYLRNDGVILNNSLVKGENGDDEFDNIGASGASITDSVINMGDGADKVRNLTGATIDATDIFTYTGNDTLTNNAALDNSNVDLGSDDDRFDNNSTGVVDGTDIMTGGGMDTIINAGTITSSTTNPSTIDGGSGADVIKNDPGGLIEANTIINGGDGNDSISNGDGVDSALIRNTTINGGANADAITNYSTSKINNSTINGDGGGDTIINENGAKILDSTIDGGAFNDVITNEGTIEGTDGTTIISHIFGGEGNDTITNEVSGKITDTAIDTFTGDDSLLNEGTIQGTVNIDSSELVLGLGNDTLTNTGTITTAVITGRSGDDSITSSPSSTITDVLIAGEDGDDTILIEGQGSGTLVGDGVFQNPGADSIEISSTGSYTGDIIGDSAFVPEGDTLVGGNDIIKVVGDLQGDIYGDLLDEDEEAGSTTTSDGGDDNITIVGGASVTGNIYGDWVPDDGGNDSIVISGTVTGSVMGDKVDGEGGVDTIKVFASGRVTGDVVGDDAGTPANVANNGLDDRIVVNGVVEGTVYVDNVGGPTADVASGSDVSAIDFATGGNDIVIVAGQIMGGIAAATGDDGDDIIVIQDGGMVGGVIDGGAHVEGDSLIFDLSTWSKGEYNDLAELFEGLTVEDGRVRYRGNRYNWVNFEVLDYFIQLFQKRTVPLRCGGVYKLNDEGTACEAYGREAQDAITFHRNNPGYDGRLPGTEACAIYNYGNAMRVYEVVDGAEGELVTTISADVFSQDIGSNVMLASSASGNVHVYYLTSNEVQVECRDWTGKTQVRIIPDFSGTVNASFDKAEG